MLQMLIAFLLLGPVIFFCSLALAYRYQARQAEARANRAEGALSISQDYGEKMRDLAAKAIECAAEKHFPARHKSDLELRWSVDDVKKAAANYVPPVVAYCRNCNVSVRHDADAYPVPCPACKTLIDPILDNPPTL